jgi:hypothetical protein
MRAMPVTTGEALPQWAKYALVVDCETTTTLDQKLTIGFARWVELLDGCYICQEEIIFYGNDLEDNAVQLLRKFARTHKADVEPGYPTKMSVMSRNEFVNGPLWNIIQAGGCVVGYNLPFDISRLAHDYTSTAKNDGWSFIMFTYPSGKENKHRPRIIIVPKDSHTTFIRLAGGRPRQKGKPVPCSGRLHPAGKRAFIPSDDRAVIRSPYMAAAGVLCEDHTARRVAARKGSIRWENDEYRIESPLQRPADLVCRA